jgi:hypothetical protein
VFDTADAEAVEHFNTNGWLLTQTLDADGSPHCGRGSTDLSVADGDR